MSNYRFDISSDFLEFDTDSFSVDRGSILHSGIYNREFASTLAAGGCLALAGFFFVERIRISVLNFFIVLLLFAILFFLFRIFAFRDPSLKVEIDKTQGVISIHTGGLLSNKTASFGLGELDNVRQDYISISSYNPDGVRVVEKIALQHGTVIPGFGETKELYTVELEFKSGTREVIFSSEKPAEAEAVATKFNGFLTTNKNE